MTRSFVLGGIVAAGVSLLCLGIVSASPPRALTNDSPLSRSPSMLTRKGTHVRAPLAHGPMIRALATAAPASSSAPPAGNAGSTPASSPTAAPTASSSSTSAAPPKPAAPISSQTIAASYLLTGQSDGNGRYTGAATMSLIGGSMFNATWNIGNNAYTGVAFRDDNLLSCGWSPKALDANVMAYLIKTDGLDGAWFEAGGTQLGSEYLIPQPPRRISSNLAGSYKINRGKNPDGSSYTGTATIKPVPGATDAYQIDWVVAGAHQLGVCLVSAAAASNAELSCGFADTSTSYGALSYLVSPDGTLSGRWIQSVNGAIALGAETATPAPAKP